jgi:hypothetical protein
MQQKDYVKFSQSDCHIKIALAARFVTVTGCWFNEMCIQAICRAAKKRLAPFADG